jgi:hypothetical protein
MAGIVIPPGDAHRAWDELNTEWLERAITVAVDALRDQEEEIARLNALVGAQEFALDKLYGMILTAMRGDQ